MISYLRSSFSTPALPQPSYHSPPLHIRLLTTSFFFSPLPYLPSLASPNLSTHFDLLLCLSFFFRLLEANRSGF